jgi:hypothetical protein
MANGIVNVGSGMTIGGIVKPRPGNPGGPGIVKLIAPRFGRLGSGITIGGIVRLNPGNPGNPGIDKLIAPRLGRLGSGMTIGGIVKGEKLQATTPQPSRS